MRGLPPATFVMAPEDVIVARVRDIDDKVCPPATARLGRKTKGGLLCEAISLGRCLRTPFFSLCPLSGRAWTSCGGRLFFVPQENGICRLCHRFRSCRRGCHGFNYIPCGFSYACLSLVLIVGAIFSGYSSFVLSLSWCRGDMVGAVATIRRSATDAAIFAFLFLRRTLLPPSCAPTTAYLAGLVLNTLHAVVVVVVVVIVSSSSLSKVSWALGRGDFAGAVSVALEQRHLLRRHDFQVGHSFLALFGRDGMGQGGTKWNGMESRRRAGTEEVFSPVFLLPCGDPVFPNKGRSKTRGYDGAVHSGNLRRITKIINNSTDKRPTR